MAAPSQEYPPWLTPVPSVILDPNGVPIATTTTVLYLPLTYYGPSIPLNSDWTYGGLTPPASTATTLPPTISITTPLTTTDTTAIPTSLTLSSSSISSATSLISSSTQITPSSSLSPSITPTTTQTPLPPPNPSSGLSRGQLVGVIVASILGFIFLLVLILAIYLFCKGRRRRRRTGGGEGDAGIDDDYLIVSSGGRFPGEGSPRHSGEEADPFLQPRSGAGGGMSEKGSTGAGAYTEMGARSPPPVPPKSTSPSRVPPPPIGSMTSSNSSSTNSGYGEPLAQPTLGIRPIREEHEGERSGGRILSPAEMREVNRESVLPASDDDDGDHHRHDQAYTGAFAYAADVPLLPPPRLVDPASKKTSSEFAQPMKPQPPSYMHRGSLTTSHRSSLLLPPDADENATLLTARRVKVEDVSATPRVATLVSATASSSSSPVTEYGAAAAAASRQTSSAGILSGLGLGAFGKRLSWFKGDARSSPRTSVAVEEDMTGLEHGGRQPRMRDTLGSGLVGLGPDGARPISSVSGKSQNSGGTIYHDASSSLPGTPPRLSPLRRTVVLPDAPPMAAASTAALGSSSWQAQSQTQQLQHQQRSAQQAPFEGSPSGTSYTQTLVPGFDILDMPAPSAMPSFGSSFSNQVSMNSTLNTLVSSRPSEAGIRTYAAVPPGLEPIPTPKVWSETASRGEQQHLPMMMPLPRPGSFGGSGGGGEENVTGIAIDVLEEEPPVAGEGWRSMAAAVAASAGGDRFTRRTTFGIPQYIHQPDHTSEQASLFSMKSHLRPSSPRSTGSAPVSARDGSVGSGSSRPSAYSAAGRSGRGSGISSLARSGSVISDGRGRPFGSVSPSLSAFGPPMSVRGGGAASDHGSREGSASASAEGVGVGVATLQSPSNAYLPLSPMSPLGMPWAGGLDDDWNAS